MKISGFFDERQNPMDRKPIMPVQSHSGSRRMLTLPLSSHSPITDDS